MYRPYRRLYQGTHTHTHALNAQNVPELQGAKLFLLPSSSSSGIRICRTGCLPLLGWNCGGHSEELKPPASLLLFGQTHSLS